MDAATTRKRSAHRTSPAPRAHEARRAPPMPFEFVKLRLGSRCVPAVQIVAGRHCLIDELPDGLARDALRAWLIEHGLLEIRIDKTQSG